jgi:hypothetical protein
MLIMTRVIIYVAPPHPHPHRVPDPFVETNSVQYTSQRLAHVSVLSILHPFYHDVNPPFMDGCPKMKSSMHAAHSANDTSMTKEKNVVNEKKILHKKNLGHLCNLNHCPCMLQLDETVTQSVTLAK